MTSLAFEFPMTPGQAQEWKELGQELRGPRRSEYHAFRRRLGLTAQRMYLQQTPQGERAIMYLEGNDLQRTFQQLRTSQDPLAICFRRQAKDLFDGLDSNPTPPGSLSKLVFDGSGAEENEADYHTLKVLERLGMISP